MESLNAIIQKISSMVWGDFLMFVLLAAGLYLTLRLVFIQIKRLPYALGILTGKYDNPDDPGDITHKQALYTAISATVGIGNIAGVATAIHLGGPGALFWMWVTAFFGMALKYSECLLGHLYRFVHKDGSVSGGAMYYIEKGMGPKWKPLAYAFALFTVIASFGIGNMVQSNTVAQALQTTFNIPPVVTGLILATLLFLVIIGGIKRIAQFASKLSPIMCTFYILGAAAVLALNYKMIIPGLKLVVVSAFNPQAALGGAAGFSILMVMRYGVARGLFSNEAGMGSAPIAHAAAKTTEPVRQALVSMLETFIDTFIICSMTGLVIVVSGAWKTGTTSGELATLAFQNGLGIANGLYIVPIAICLFAFSTAISWSYYGDRCMEYLFGEKSVILYRLVYVALYFVGAVSALKLIWNLADITNGLMVFPNLIALIALSPIIVKATRDYFNKSNGKTSKLCLDNQPCPIPEAKKEVKV
ncbi:MAG: sodium:alanine symporter family protein [Armatimonadota bacterium]